MEGSTLDIHLYNRQSPGKWSNLLLILVNIFLRGTMKGLKLTLFLSKVTF